MYLCKVGTQSSALINQGVLISEVFFYKRFHCIFIERELGWWLLEVIAQLSGHLLLNLARSPGLVPSDCGLFTFFYFTS